MIWIAGVGWVLFIASSVLSVYETRRHHLELTGRDNAMDIWKERSEVLENSYEDQQKQIRELKSDLAAEKAVTARQESLIDYRDRVIDQRNAEIKRIGVTRGANGRLQKRGAL